MAPKKRILVVDDDSRIADPVVELFEDAGFEAKAVNESRAALSTAVQWRPDLILLDLEMPDMDGAEVLHELRSNPDTKNIPVVVVSVLARNLDAPPGEVQGFLCKPITFQEILAQVKQAMVPGKDRP